MNETLIGVARYGMDSSGDSCEFALVIADAWQGRGLGKCVLESLVEAARARSIPRLTGLTLSTNAAMLRPARRRSSCQQERQHK